MKLVTALLSLISPKKEGRRSIESYKQDVLIRQGRIQFEKLMQKGLQVPIVLL